MAINKNFVIKNGVEVNTSLIVGDATLNKVGVGTTVPGYTLHVGGSRGGIGATDLTVTGIATVGTSGSTAAALSVVGVSTFQGDIILLGSAGVSTISFDASLDKLNFADNARATFGTGNDLQIYHDGSNSYIQEAGTGSLIIYGTGETLAAFTDDGSVQLYNNDSKKLETTGLGITVYGDAIVSGVVTAASLNVTGVSTFTSVGSNLIPNADGTRNIGAATSEWGDLFIDGTANIDALVADTAIVSDLTENRVVIAGASGELEDDGDFTFDGDQLKVGLGTIQVNGNAAFAGIVTVGGNLSVTGDLLIQEDVVLDTNLTILGIATISNLDNTGAGIGSLSVSGVSTFSGDLIVGVSTLFADVSTGRIGIGTAVPASTLDVDGALTVNSAKVEDLTDNRVVIAGTDGELEDSGNLTFDGSTLAVTGDQTVSGEVSVGSGVTAFANGNLAVAGISTFNDNVLVGTGITIQPHGGVSIAGITTIGSHLNVTGNSYFVGMVTFAGGTNGNITLGDSAGDNVVFNADVNSNVIPNTNNTYDLGSSGQQWKDIYIDGIGYIDTVSADGVGIATATIRDSAKLDVDGDARFSGRVAVKDGGNAGVGVTIFDNGNIVASGIITANTFVGSFNGTVTAATNVTVADESSDATCFPLFVTAATGDLAPKSGSNLTFDSTNGTLTATTFAGNLTGGTVSGTTGTFSSDVDIADKIVHTSDTNTAIRFPAADTFSVETGGGEALRVDSSQRLLIGATSSTDLIRLGQAFAVATTDEFGGGSFTGFNGTTANEGPIIDLQRSRATSKSPGTVVVDDDRLGSIVFRGDDGTDFADAAYMLGEVDGTPNGGFVPGRFTFFTGTTSAVPTERLRITSDGKLGLGEQSPDFKFHSKETGGSSVAGLFETNQTDAFISFQASGTSSSSTVRIGAVGDNFQAFVNGAERLRITSGGDVKVSTATTIFANGNATFSGISTFGGTSHVRIPVGTTAQRDSNAVNGDIRYNTTLNSYEGYGNGAWGGLGGGTEIDVSVSSTSATNLTTFAHASYRSASMRIQITQGSSYQVGKYLLIHDGTTVTIVEEAAIATGDMLGSISGTINGSNVEVKVTMNSASSATVTTIIDKITV